MVFAMQLTDEEIELNRISLAYRPGAGKLLHTSAQQISCHKDVA
jgi:hypothetical protein